MQKHLQKILLVLALLSLAFSTIAHSSAPSHDALDCSVCLYQPLSDLIEAPKSLELDPSQWAGEAISSRYSELYLYQAASPFMGRAPPISR